MGNPLFGVNISKLIADNVGPGVLDATLIKVSSGSRTAGQLTGGTNPTSVSYSCKGFIDTQAVRNMDGTLANAGSKVIVLIGDTISGGQVPVTDDRITIEGTTYIIETVDRDPAAATYTCGVRNL